jgi:hypothetical protein
MGVAARKASNGGYLALGTGLWMSYGCGDDQH